MRPLILATLMPTAVLLAIAPAEARSLHRKPSHRQMSDMDVTLARRAEGDRLRGWRAWQAPRSFARALPPATRERVAAPPFTGWGYGGTIPGAWPGF
ncbi:hypothetical protein [Methylobacterium pseudosasicola]|uniref:Uncharacterized protein n=1 Tax=Methylobacterium pseudosasicola TaxID=582667 RepID=A0A1I4MJ01_9HYPH|nr:hypothetical protein [Methylobacterium pseudosasicola]SFM03158.1 hypothetical protein SAMN05192568_101710 [Methylobacterium pseudosasicola]